MAGALGIEPRLTESKSVVLPLHNAPTIKQDTFTFQVQVEFFKFAVSILNLVLPPGVEPGSTVLQTAAMTASAKVANLLVPHDRIELPLPDYKTGVLPFN